MEIIYFKDSEANAIRGFYKNHHELQPSYYGKNFNLLNKDAVNKIQSDLSNDLKLKINDKSTFVVGDGSKEAIKYQEYLDNQIIEV